MNASALSGFLRFGGMPEGVLAGLGVGLPVVF